MIEIENLNVTYPETRGHSKVVAIPSLSTVFQDGSFNVIVGASGCGKTSLIHSIAGLLDYEGSIRFDGVDAKNLDISSRDMALVSQSYILYPTMTVFDNIAFPLRSRGAEKKEIISLVNEVAKSLDIEYLLQRKPKELSGGQQQRVALARALIKKPSIYLFDEPLSNVSEENREIERNLIRKAVRLYGSMAIYVTHNMREATALADKLIVMDEGKIIEEGRPMDVIHSQNPVVKALMEAADVI